MSTHVPDRHAVKTLLDAEGLERTLSRIAHEIIERNDDLGRLALVGIHTRGVPIAERLATLIEERSGEEVALGAVDITFHRDDATPDAEQPVVHATALDFELAGMTSSSSTTSSTPAARSGPRSRRSSSAAGPRASSSPSSSTAATASCRSGPTTSARTCRPRAASGSRSSSTETDGADRILLVGAPEEEA